MKKVILASAVCALGFFLAPFALAHADDNAYEIKYPFKSAVISAQQRGKPYKIYIKNGMTRIEGGRYYLPGHHTITRDGYIYNFNDGKFTSKQPAAATTLKLIADAESVEDREKSLSGVQKLGPHLPRYIPIMHEYIDVAPARNISGQEVQCHSFESDNAAFPPSENCYWYGIEVLAQNRAMNSDQIVTKVQADTIEIDVSVDDALFTVPSDAPLTFQPMQEVVQQNMKIVFDSLATKNSEDDPTLAPFVVLAR